MKNNNKSEFGPGNPHPLSKMKTELIWEGKYDEHGNRREIDIAGLSMPMQKIETVDEPRSEAAAKGAKQLDAFEKDIAKKRQDDFRNMLIWGDNKLVMASLLKDFKGKIDLIYIDPPFDVGADFTMNVPVGDDNGLIEKDQSTLEMVAYRDMWGKGTDSYLQIMYERLLLMRELLSDMGSIYVHCDWHVNHLLRSMLDEVFSFYRNEIIWQKIRVVKSQAKSFGNVHDTLLVYSRSDSPIFKRLKGKQDEAYESKFDKIDTATGRQYQLVSLVQRGQGPARRFGKKVMEPGPGRHWIWSQERIDAAMKEGLIEFTSGGLPRKKQYLDESEGKDLSDIWADIYPVNSQALEDTLYDTQKPESLLERIIEASSIEDSIIGDFFCGSGTTGAVAERLGRRWIMADLGRFAIHTSRKRLIELQRKLHVEEKPYRAFDVYNLGRYERQWWQKERLKGADEEHRRVVLEFFKAEILKQAPSPLIHGRKSGAFCHVDSIDSIFTREEAKAVAQAVAQAGGKEVYCLAWEFEMDLRLTTAALEQELGVRLKLIPIPREIMEKNRTSPPPFLEMAVLEAKPVYGKDEKKKRTVDIKLEKFIPSLAEVPSKELEALKERAVKSGIDFVDFWAIDFEWEPGKPFAHHWQDYRIRKDRSLKTVSDAGHIYSKPGIYMACVKVVDTFGCDTSITVEVKV